MPFCKGDYSTDHQTVPHSIFKPLPRFLYDHDESNHLCVSDYYLVLTSIHGICAMFRFLHTCPYMSIHVLTFSIHTNHTLQHFQHFTTMRLCKWGFSAPHSLQNLVLCSPLPRFSLSLLPKLTLCAP